MADGPLYIRIAVVAVNILLIIFHALAAGITIIAAPVSKAARERSALHRMCIKISARVVGNWFRNRGDDWRFHHRDYSLAALLLPGRFSEFGRWSLLDDIIGYDSLGYMERGAYVFVRNRAGEIEYKPMPAEHWPADMPETITRRPDGMLRLVSRTVDIDGETVSIHPSDSYFEKHLGRIAKSLFHLAPRDCLDVIGRVNDEMIDAVKKTGLDLGPIRPELLRIRRQ